MKNKKENKKLALAQIFILIIGIIAIGYSIGSQIKVVSGAGITPLLVSKIKIFAGEFWSSIPSGGLSTISSASGSLFFSLFYAAVLSLSVSLLAQLFGMNANDAQKLGISIGGFFGTTSFLYQIFGTGGVLSESSLALLGNPYVATLIGIYVAYKLFTGAFSKEYVKSISFECKPWKAPIGGDYCDLCNDDEILGCTEYQCKSLGSLCELVNKGTGQEKCVSVDRGDISPPVITAWKEILPYGYRYEPDLDMVFPNQGVEIKYNGTTDGCVKGYEVFSFGVTLDKVGTCRIDNIHTDSYEDMNPLGMGGNNLYIFNHSQVIMYPNQDDLDGAYEVSTGEEHSFFVRCESNNGNSNEAEFGFKFCVTEDEDISEPHIYSSNPSPGNPITWFNETEEHEQEVTLYLNEPSECKWDHIDKNYEDMENPMSCVTSPFELNTQLAYECTSTLTGIVNNQENTFYFRCKDQPLLEDANKRNVMGESYVLNLIGTNPLVLSDLEPKNDEIIKGATGSVRVPFSAETSAGYQNGKAICEYKNLNEEGIYTQFEHTDSYTHSTNVWLEEGTYEYRIRCYDFAGNFASEIINFNVETDTQSPIIVRAYHESSYLKIITNEESTCVYDTVDCSYPYGNGLSMNNIGNINHFTDWNTNVNYYIKCEDEFGNRPAPDQCSMTIRPMEI